MLDGVAGLRKRGLATVTPIVWTVTTWSDGREQGIAIGTVFMRFVCGWIIGELGESLAGRGKDPTAMAATRERTFIRVGKRRKGGVAFGAEFHLC